MDFGKVLRECEDPKVGAAVAGAIDKLFAEDLILLKKNAHERSIAGRLQIYLEPFFEGLNVTIEYNLMGDSPKKVAWRGDEPEQVFPDIIVHQIGTKTNILAIELKKDSSRKSKSDDILKLQAYRRELNYQHALFIRLGVRKTAGSVSECEWVRA